ncbi:MAG: geranylgeranyl reductase family protein [Aquificota bacterium]|nr:geranylgeranyl reductase family protein [Aquificota bacterium]
MDRYDAVVVGGGPSGATCARILAEKGARVLIVERETLPRFKLCAGCLSARIDPLLPKGWKKLVLNSIRGGYLGFRGMSYREVSSNLPVAYIVDRSGFDHFLVKEAVASGSDLWEGTEFVRFEGEGPLKVHTTKGTVLADFLIGADGFYSKVAKQTGFGKTRFFRSVEFWTEGEVTDKVVIDIGLVKRGYAWIFPKGELVSVGIASVGKDNLRKIIETYVAGNPFLKVRGVAGVKGWMIPFTEHWGDLQLGRGRVMLVGDSASMVDPLLGEGIYYGVLGGKLLAESIIRNPSNALDLYTLKVRETIFPELLYAGKIARTAYRFQRTAHRVGEKALLRFLYLLSGVTSYGELYRKGLVGFLISALNFENFLHIIIDKILRRR